jgi:hypothetical protein
MRMIIIIPSSLIPNVRALSSGEAKGKSPFALLGLSGDERGDTQTGILRRWPCPTTNNSVG